MQFEVNLVFDLFPLDIVPLHHLVNFKNELLLALSVLSAVRVLRKSYVLGQGLCPMDLVICFFAFLFEGAVDVFDLIFNLFFKLCQSGIDFVDSFFDNFEIGVDFVLNAFV